MARYYPVGDVLAARARVATLHAVERMRVIACAYRTYPLTALDPSLLPVYADGSSAAGAVQHQQYQQDPLGLGHDPSDPLGGAFGGEGGGATRGPGSKPPLISYLDPNRPPCMWLLMQRVLPDGAVDAGTRGTPHLPLSGPVFFLVCSRLVPAGSA